MKKKIISLLLSATLIFSITGCGKSSDSGPNPFNKTETTETTEAPTTISSDYLPEDIILINNYLNYAWGYEQYGWFLTGSGDIYRYDFSNEFIPVYLFSDETYSLIDMLKIIQANSKPTGKCDPAKVEKIYQEGMQIDPNAEYTSENTACDAGENRLEFYNNKTNELILVESTGDTEALPTDIHAKEVRAYASDMDLNSTKEESVTLFTPNNYYFGYSNCGYMDGLDGNYVLFNKGELEAFKEQTGIDIPSLLPKDFSPDIDYGAYVYIVNITNVPTPGYNIHYDALLKQGETFKFIPAKDYSTPDATDTVAEEMDGFINVCAVCTSVGSPEYYTYLDVNGKEFNRLEGKELPDDKDDKKDDLIFPKEAAGEYYFASGAGGWSTDLTVHEDGTFEATYHDSDLGDSGDGYDSTMYIGTCSGKFKIESNVNEGIYEMSIEITEHSKTDTEEFKTENYGDEDYIVRYVYSDVYGIDDSRVFWLILEGTPTDMLPEDYISWISSPHAWGNDIPEKLPFNGIYNIEGSYGFGQ